MKKNLLYALLLLCIFLTACNATSVGIIGGADGPTAVMVTDGEKSMDYTIITQEEAKRIMDSGESYVLLDVREQEEFDAGHIPDAILIPHTQITERAEEMLPDKSAQILVYCRSGRRSKIAAAALGALGYTNIKEFGGIIDWPYEIVK